MSTDTQELQRLLEGMNRQKNPIHLTELRRFIERPQGPILPDQVVSVERLSEKPLAIYYGEDSGELWRVEFAYVRDDKVHCVVRSKEGTEIFFRTSWRAHLDQSKMKIIGINSAGYPVLVDEDCTTRTPAKHVYTWEDELQLHTAKFNGADCFVALLDEEKLIATYNYYLGDEDQYRHGPGATEWMKSRFGVVGYDACGLRIMSKPTILSDVHKFVALQGCWDGGVAGLFQLPETNINVPMLLLKEHKEIIKPTLDDNFRYIDLLGFDGEWHFVFMYCGNERGLEFGFTKIDFEAMSLVPSSLGLNMAGPYGHKYLRGGRLLEVTQAGMRFAYVGKAPHGLECWCLNGVPSQPAFDKVTDLWQEEDKWMYYGSVGRHLCKVELPMVGE